MKKKIILKTLLILSFMNLLSCQEKISNKLIGSWHIESMAPTEDTISIQTGLTLVLGKEQMIARLNFTQDSVEMLNSNNAVVLTVKYKYNNQSNTITLDPFPVKYNMELSKNNTIKMVVGDFEYNFKK